MPARHRFCDARGVRPLGVEYAHGKPLSEILESATAKMARLCTTRNARNCTRKSWTRFLMRRHLQARPANRTLQRAVPAAPLWSFYTTRGCPALCTFCMWPQTISGHAWRTRSTENVGAGSEAGARILPADERDFLRRRHLLTSAKTGAGSMRQVQKR